VFCQLAGSVLRLLLEIRATFALVSYLGITIGISQLVAETLPSPTSPSVPQSGHPPFLFRLSRGFSIILRSAVNSFVWGKMYPEYDWRRLFHLGGDNDARAIGSRIIVGAVTMGILELFGIMAMIKSRKLALCIPMHFVLSAFFVEPGGGRIATCMRSFSMIFVSIGVTRQVQSVVSPL
jgi:hypothetical protein